MASTLQKVGAMSYWLLTSCLTGGSGIGKLPLNFGMELVYVRADDGGINKFDSQGDFDG